MVGFPTDDSTIPLGWNVYATSTPGLPLSSVTPVFIPWSGSSAELDESPPDWKPRFYRATILAAGGESAPSLEVSATPSGGFVLVQDAAGIEVFRADDPGHPAVGTLPSATLVADGYGSPNRFTVPAPTATAPDATTAGWFASSVPATAWSVPGERYDFVSGDTVRVQTSGLYSYPGSPAAGCQSLPLDPPRATNGNAVQCDGDVYVTSDDYPGVWSKFPGRVVVGRYQSAVILQDPVTSHLTWVAIYLLPPQEFDLLGPAGAFAKEEFLAAGNAAAVATQTTGAWSITLTHPSTTLPSAAIPGAFSALPAALPGPGTGFGFRVDNQQILRTYGDSYTELYPGTGGYVFGESSLAYDPASGTHLHVPTLVPTDLVIAPPSDVRLAQPFGPGYCAYFVTTGGDLVCANVNFWSAVERSTLGPVGPNPALFAASSSFGLVFHVDSAQHAWISAANGSSARMLDDIPSSSLVEAGDDQKTLFLLRTRIDGEGDLIEYDPSSGEQTVIATVRGVVRAAFFPFDS